MTKEVSTPRRVASEWLDKGHRVVAATLIDRIGSSPLDPGAEMFIDDRQSIEGTVTGGCVESALVEEARQILAGESAKVMSYGLSDEAASGVGLMCGGTVRIFVHELLPGAAEILAAADAAQAREEPAAIATVLGGDRPGAKMALVPEGRIGSLGFELLDHNVERESQGFIDEGVSRVRNYGGGGEIMGDELPVLIQALQTPPEMVIYGSIDYSVALARLAGEIGYRVTICDARRPFAEGRRFSEVAEVVVDWPDRDLARRDLGPRDAVLVFTHDPKFDEPALIGALRSGAGYVGALGSRKTQEHRIDRLRVAGLAEGEISRLHAPCGLDLGARTPEETSISILAEVVAARTGRTGEALRGTAGAIHPGS